MTHSTGAGTSSTAGPGLTLRAEAHRAWCNLTTALAELRDLGAGSPCHLDPEPFTSDDHRAREAAALACAGCPALAQCAAFAGANDEPHHVWAGVDLTAIRGAGAVLRRRAALQASATAASGPSSEAAA